jgi:uncharacterized protein involved in outer membrane biogenesis
MKFFFKWALRIFLLLVILALVFGVAIFLCKDWLLRKTAESAIAAQTGLETHIGGLHVGIGSPVVTLTDFKLYNPREFGGAPLVDMPELHLEYDPAALAAGKLRIKLLRLNLAEVNLVRNQAGQTNTVALQKKMSPGKSAKPQGFGQIKFEQMDTLDLSLGKFRFTDMGNPAADRQINLNLKHQVFHNLKSQEEIGGAVFGAVVVAALQNGSELSGQLHNPPGALLDSFHALLKK